MRRDQTESTKTVLVALTANVVIAGAKAVAGLVTGSQGLLAEAAHSAADSANQVSLLVSLSLGRRPPDEEHPFGYGKERFFWAFIAALLIFAVGASFSVFEGVRKLLEPGARHMGSLRIAYGVLGVALLAEGTSLVRAVRQWQREEGGSRRRSAIAAFRRSTEPAVKTVLVEDGAAVLGVLLAGGGLALFQLTGDTYWDAWASIAIGCLLAVAAFSLGRDMRGLLLGAAAPPDVRDRMRATIGAHPAVDRVIEVLTMYLGPRSLLVAVRLDLADTVTGDEVEQASDAIERALRQAEPEVTEVFLDATPAGRAGRGTTARTRMRRT